MSTRQQIHDSILAYWDFDAGNPNEALVDRSGQVPDLLGTSELIPGIHGQAGSWPSTSGGYDNDQLGDYFDMRDRPFTFSAWYRADESTNLGQWLHLGAGSNQVRFRVSESNFRMVFMRDGTNVSLEEPLNSDPGWHHIVAGNDPGVRRVIYHDGVLAASATNGTTGLRDNSGSAQIGDSRQPLDEIMLAEVAPTDAIAAYLYNDGQGRSWDEISGAVTIPETPEEIWRANFAEASGADPWQSALIRSADAQRLADHNVLQFINRPQWYRLPVEIEAGELDDYRIGTVRTFRADLPGLRNGKKLRIYSRQGSARPGTVILLCRG